MTPGRMTIGIISAGKVGSVLGAALRAAGHTVIGAVARSSASRERLDALLPGVPARETEYLLARADLILLALPDAALPGVVEHAAGQGWWRPGQLVIHTSARFGTGVLRDAAAAGALTLALHPALTFTGTSLDMRQLIGATWAVTSSAPLQPIGMALVSELGGEPSVLAEENRGLYAAALTHASRHTALLAGQVQRMLAAAGLEPSFARGLQEQALAMADAGIELIDPPAGGVVAEKNEDAPAPDDITAVEALAATGNYPDIPPVYRVIRAASRDRAARRRLP